MYFTSLALILLASLFSLVLADDYGNTIATAYSWGLNLVISGYIDNGGDMDYFKVKLVIGRTYSIGMESTPTAYDNYLILYDFDGVEVKRDDDSGPGVNALLTYTPTKTGDYYIEAKGYRPDRYGAYKLGISDTTPCDTACDSCQTITSLCSFCLNGYKCNSCSSDNEEYVYRNGGACYCASDEFFDAGTCKTCRDIDSKCLTCSGGNCTSCASGLFLTANTCSTGCPAGFYIDSGTCVDCNTLDPSCLSCSSSSVCTGCSDDLLAFEDECVENCPEGTYNNNNGRCIACSTLHSQCATCSSSISCSSCSGTKYALGATCENSCPSNYMTIPGVCFSCKSMDNSCETCNSTSQCLSCSGSLLASGNACATSCPTGTFDNTGLCTSCLTLDDYCTTCNSSLTCTACAGSRFGLGSSCVFNCPVGTYKYSGLCTACKTMDNYCVRCSDLGSCLECSNNKVAYGSACYDKCPFGTKNDTGVCVLIPLVITLINTEEPNIYLADFASPLVLDIQVPAVSKLSLVGISASAYSITMAKQTDTVYQITIAYTETIPSATLRLVYTLNGVPTTTNVLRGTWTASITSKYLAYMSEGTKAAVEAVNKVAGGTMQGAATGAGSMAILGGNPALLWPLLNLFQAFYYLIFIDVNYPANVQMFLKIFSLGSLGFIPNPLEWFVKDIDAYNLPVPKRYNDYNFSGLFLDNAGNELLLLVFVFVFYMMSKVSKKWIRRLPNSIRLVTNKTVGWFEWSGILRSLITSYTDMAQAIFLQMKVLTFYSTVFTLSSILSFLTLGFVVFFPILIFLVIRRFDDHPELLYIKYETLVKEFDVTKKAARNFIVIWLIRRLVMCLSLVFLQGYPYVQINILCILMAGAIFHSWVYAPYATKKENICNTLMEILFGLIHGVIYVLIYDDHNPSFTEEQRLQMGWVIIFACGVILVISMGLSLIEQFREVLRAIKLLKQFLKKKPEKAKGKKNKEIDETTINVTTGDQNTMLTDQSNLFDANRTSLETTADMPSSPIGRSRRNTHIPVSQIRQMRRAQLAHRIRELRAINS